LVVPSTTALRARATRSSSSSKVAKFVGGPDIGQSAVPLCSRTQVVTSRERSTWSGVSVVVVMVGVGVSQGHIKPLGRTMEWIEGGETSDKGLGFIRNEIQARTLKFNFGISILLGKGHGVVGTKRGVTAEENVRDNGCAERESNEPAFRLCMQVEAIILVNQMSMGFPWLVFLMTSGAT